MTSFAKNPIRYLIFAGLLVYATTGDFMATSVFSDGHDCDHPLVRIEHKCVTNSSRIEHEDRTPSLGTWMTIVFAVVFGGTRQAIVYFQDRAAALGSTDLSQEPVPLRC